MAYALHVPDLAGSGRLSEVVLPIRSRLSCERLLYRLRRVGKTNPVERRRLHALRRHIDRFLLTLPALVVGYGSHAADTDARSSRRRRL